MQKEKELGEGWQQAKRPKVNPNPNSKKEKEKQRGQKDTENIFAILGSQEKEPVSKENTAEKQDNSEAASQQNKENNLQARTRRNP
jgi:hypothetical protein